MISIWRQAWGGLDTLCVGEEPAAQGGGTAVVLLHGWGEPGDALVPLASALVQGDARLFMPAAPLDLADGGRAWWPLEPGDRPSWAWDDYASPEYMPHREVVGARFAVQRLLAGIIKDYAPDTVVVVGFSQGAMLALDVGLRDEPAVDRVVAMSGVMLADSLPALAAVTAAAPRFLLTHGTEDDEVPFEAGERARDLLTGRGLDVTWRPLPGGHEISDAAVTALREFIYES
jgi:phospholipase/carboxylesterase